MRRAGCACVRVCALDATDHLSLCTPHPRRAAAARAACVWCCSYCRRPVCLSVCLCVCLRVGDAWPCLGDTWPPTASHVASHRTAGRPPELVVDIADVAWTACYKQHWSTLNSTSCERLQQATDALTPLLPSAIIAVQRQLRHCDRRRLDVIYKHTRYLKLIGLVVNEWMNEGMNHWFRYNDFLGLVTFLKLCRNLQLRKSTVILLSSTFISRRYYS